MFKNNSRNNIRGRIINRCIMNIYKILLENNILERLVELLYN